MRVSRLSLLAVCLFTVALFAQSAADIQRIDDMRAWLKSIEPQLTSTGITNARNISTRLNTLKGQFLPTTPPPTVPTLDSVSLTPATVVGGATVAAVVTLSGATSADTAVTLVSSRPFMAPVPASVTVPAGQSSVGFDIVTPPSTESADRTATITATLAGISKTANMVIQPTGTTPPPPTEICGNGIDDDGDGQVDEGCNTPPPAEICGNGIDDDGDGQIDEGCSTTPPPPGTHGYFDQLVARPEKSADYSLRDPKQLQTRANGGYAYCNSCSLDVTYDATADAAKVVVGTSSNSLRNQIRLPIPAYGSSLFVTWDAWYGDEYRYAVSGIPTYKQFQFASPFDRIWTEVRSRFSQATAGDIARVDVRYYGTSFGPGSGWDWTMSGKWAGSMDAIGPQTGEFNIAPQTWTRYFVHIEQDPSGFWAFSLWMADAARGPVNLLDRRLIKPNGSSPWESFWLEYNTSTSTVKAGRPSLVGYVRNVVMLKGVTFSQVSALLVKP